MAKEREIVVTATLNGKPVVSAEPSQEITDILCSAFLGRFLAEGKKGAANETT